ncbi:uncharacterized protein BDR25DRAFT_627 [Lindgomyces ingoldianus]|uniref:Uncharacterized protein n=1 Tax=Lindgomyces ingoldianus TaxID=673940 RepID=A0ACB6RDK4_9PLEO|nr:uncharacterized protein BDR25DRAFT_627 [Lindgomyces ingoldianus]KAF2477423.1 hypothetical protein BDR25DRAFT_627 [Lindgomyces ingoldianus]
MYNGCDSRLQYFLYGFLSSLFFLVGFGIYCRCAFPDGPLPAGGSPLLGIITPYQAPRLVATQLGSQNWAKWILYILQCFGPRCNTKSNLRCEVKDMSATANDVVHHPASAPSLACSRHQFISHHGFLELWHVP